MKLNCAGKILDLSTPRVMGILNATPDSFSDGGQLFAEQNLDIDLALRRAEKMVEDGASIIDIGGESTRPGAKPVSLQEEMDRVIPVVESIHHRLDTIISVDTSSPEVMAEAARVGAGLINDVRALQKEGAVEALARSGLPACLMHMQGEPDTMQDAPQYQDVVEEVLAFLSARIAVCEEAGIKKSDLLIDPGFGFGKTLEHNLFLVKYLDRLQSLGCLVLVGLSRKSMIGKITGSEVDDRLVGSVVLAMECVSRGASIVRVHDVKETVEALQIHQAVLKS